MVIHLGLPDTVNILFWCWDCNFDNKTSATGGLLFTAYAIYAYMTFQLYAWTF